jgi:dTDP-4-dehydrorhamnose reductase
LRFAVIGDSGMFGSDMKSRLMSTGEEVEGLNRSNIDLGLSGELLASKLEGFDVVINAVAYTAVDKAEQDTELANQINGDIPGKLARACALTGSRFIQISTDYVFDGSAGSPISNQQILDPINAYGRSKALGETLVSDSGADFTILRTSWLYGANGNCFPRTIARKLLSGDSVSVVSDQFGQPTWTRDLAEVALAHSLNNFGERIVHSVSSGKASWYEFALAINDSMLENQTHEIQSVTSSDYQSPAKRPKYSVLDNSNTSGPVIGNWLDRWKMAAPEVLGSVQESM